MNILFRELEERDIPQASALFARLKEERAGVSFVDYTEEEKVRGWLADENVFVYSALYEDRLVGVFKAKRGEREEGEDKSYSAFLTCATDRDFRGRSIAKEITLYGLERLREEGIKIARAYVYSDNRPSINTILSCGFQFAGSVHMHHYDEVKKIYVDDLIFHKLL